MTPSTSWNMFTPGHMSACPQYAAVPGQSRMHFKGRGLGGLDFARATFMTVAPTGFGSDGRVGHGTAPSVRATLAALGIRGR